MRVGKGCNNTTQAHHQCLGESEADNSNQDGSLKCPVRHQHTHVWQRDVVNISQTRAEAEESPPALSSSHPRYHLERQSAKHPWRAQLALPYQPCTQCSECAGTAKCALLRYNDACRRDVETLNINTESWEEIAGDRSRWRNMLRKQLKSSEAKI